MDRTLGLPQGTSEEPGIIRSIVVGLVGSGIGLSRTPAMHEAEGRARGIAYVYRLLDTGAMGPNPPELSEILRFAEIFGFVGLNITHPYKQAIIPLLDEIAEDAAVLGAVNTVVLREGRRIGHNTDLWGFRQSFLLGMVGAPRNRVALVGAGGAGAAVSQALLDVGVGHLSIIDLDLQKAKSLADALASRFGRDRVSVPGNKEEAIRLADGLVNATPVGMAGKEGLPVPGNLISSRQWVADIVYFPLETSLLSTAREKGCRTLSGEGMAVFQAVKAFRLFTGVDPDPARMRLAFERCSEVTARW